jgi:hypothetical protein
MIKYIFGKLTEIFIPIIGVLIFILIVAAIYSAIFKISYTRIIATIFIPMIALILSLFEILWMILKLPYYVYLFFVVIFNKITEIFYMMINIFNYILGFIYFTSEEDLF